MQQSKFTLSTRSAPSSRASLVWDSLLNLLFPERCLICSRPVESQRDKSVCKSCWAKVLELRISPPLCPSCGIPFESGLESISHLCLSCSVSSPSFSGARAFGYYTAGLRLLIHALKFSRRPDLASLLGPLLTATFLEWWTCEDFDLIVPVPLHPSRRRERGFNQATFLARVLSRALAVPMSERALLRIRQTPAQVGLSDARRRLNVRGAFEVGDSQKVSAKRILLVDDVMTTGATVASAARALLKCGARRVSVLTLARAVTGLE